MSARNSISTCLSHNFSLAHALLPVPCQPACPPACLPVHLPVDRQPACQPACMHVHSPAACPPTCLPIHLPFHPPFYCLPACPPACPTYLPACRQLICLSTYFPACRPIGRESLRRLSTKLRLVHIWFLFLKSSKQFSVNYRLIVHIFTGF